MTEESGYLYCVVTGDGKTCKIGYTKSTLRQLWSRYKMVYGYEQIVYAYKVNDPKKAESECHSHFDEHRLCGELFKGCKLKSYLKHLTNKYDEPLKLTCEIYDSIKSDTPKSKPTKTLKKQSNVKQTTNKCYKCNMKFNNKTQLIKHYKHRDCDIDTKYFCYMCGHDYSTNSRLKLHEQTSKHSDAVYENGIILINEDHISGLEWMHYTQRKYMPKIFYLKSDETASKNMITKLKEYKYNVEYESDEEPSNESS
jgi:hypothetical protein